VSDYSQNSEGWIVENWFANQGDDWDRRGRRFLDLGAADGILNSNTRGLSDSGWSGVLVEADPHAFVKLLANHAGNPKMTCVNAAIMGANRNYHRHRDNRTAKLKEFFDAGDQISTIYEGHKLGKLVRRTWWVAAVTPWELARVFGSRFDFVSVDLEGMDLEAIRALVPCLTETKLVCFEDSLPFTTFDQRYYDKVMAVWAGQGFGTVVGRTKDKVAGTPANTLLCRDPAWRRDRKVHWRTRRAALEVATIGAT
jgi:FkbM family methyltransferase